MTMRISLTVMLALAAFAAPSARGELICRNLVEQILCDEDQKTCETLPRTLMQKLLGKPASTYESTRKVRVVSQEAQTEAYLCIDTEAKVLALVSESNVEPWGCVKYTNEQYSRERGRTVDVSANGAFGFVSERFGLFGAPSSEVADKVAERMVTIAFKGRSSSWKRCAGPVGTEGDCVAYSRYVGRMWKIIAAPGKRSESLVFAAATEECVKALAD